MRDMFCCRTSCVSFRSNADDAHLVYCCLSSPILTPDIRPPGRFTSSTSPVFDRGAIELYIIFIYTIVAVPGQASKLINVIHGTPDCQNLQCIPSQILHRPLLLFLFLLLLLFLSVAANGAEGCKDLLEAFAACVKSAAAETS
ncbi:unnamed protein product [Boreogadus saida]